MRTSLSSRWTSTPIRIFQQAGALQASDLDDLIAQAKALDLAAAKAQQAAQEQQ